MEGLWQLLVLACLGVFGGLLSGLVGVGGGIIFVPALVYVAGWSIGDATAASFMIIIFSSLSGVLRNTSGESPVNWRAATLLVATVAPASLIGVAINRVVPDDAVKIIFAFVLLSFTYPLLSQALGKKENGDTRARRIPPAVVLLGGVAIGTLSGLVGVGGGVVMVPLMILGLDVRPKSAIATSLIVVLCTGVVAAVGYVATGFHQFSALPPLIVGSILGAWAGVRIRDRVPVKPLQIGFAAFMMLVAAQLLIDATNVF